MQGRGLLGASPSSQLLGADNQIKRADNQYLGQYTFSPPETSNLCS